MAFAFLKKKKNTDRNGEAVWKRSKIEEHSSGVTQPRGSSYWGPIGVTGRLCAPNLEVLSAV